MITIDDIRLTEDEIDSIPITNTTAGAIRLKDVANTATQKAIEKILDRIGISSSRFGYDVHSSCQLCGGQACIDTELANELSAILKELVKK